MILADTHTALWLTQERHLLSPTADRALASARSEGSIGVSCITLWEIAILATKGRIRIDGPINVYLRHVESVFNVLPITGEIAVRAMQFTSSYPDDPADRLIGATALVHGFALVTKDRKIHASGEVPAVW